MVKKHTDCVVKQGLVPWVKQSNNSNGILPKNIILSALNTLEIA